MNRREFLKVFAVAVPAIAVASEAMLDALEEGEQISFSEFENLDFSDWKPKPWDGPPMVLDLQAYGNAQRSEIATFGLDRIGSNSPILRIPMNAAGGLIRFAFRPGEQIIVPDGLPGIKVWKSSDKIEAAALMRLPGLERYQLLNAVLDKEHG